MNKDIQNIAVAINNQEELDNVIARFKKLTGFSVGRNHNKFDEQNRFVGAWDGWIVSFSSISKSDVIMSAKDFLSNVDRLVVNSAPRTNWYKLRNYR